MERIRNWAYDWADISGLAAFGSAVFLLLAMFMPNWLARTSWSRANRRHDFTSLVDSPASFVWLVSLCGLIALIGLIIGRWRRSPVAAVLAAGAFACGTYVAGNFWWGFSRGVILLDGRLSPDMGPPRWEVHTPLLLPVFLAAAVAGTIGALGLAVYWHDPRSE